MALEGPVSFSLTTRAPSLSSRMCGVSAFIPDNAPVVVPCLSVPRRGRIPLACPCTCRLCRRPSSPYGGRGPHPSLGNCPCVVARTWRGKRSGAASVVLGFPSGGPTRIRCRLDKERRGKKTTTLRLRRTELSRNPRRSRVSPPQRKPLPLVSPTGLHADLRFFFLARSFPAPPERLH